MEYFFLRLDRRSISVAGRGGAEEEVARWCQARLAGVGGAGVPRRGALRLSVSCLCLALRLTAQPPKKRGYGEPACPVPPRRPLTGAFLVSLETRPSFTPGMGWSLPNSVTGVRNRAGEQEALSVTCKVLLTGALPASSPQYLSLLGRGLLTNLLVALEKT